jgi:hypothetical protein
MFDGMWGTNYVPRKVVVEPWTKWFAWYPIKLHGRRVWLKIIYRRCVVTFIDTNEWSKYEYGTLFDIIKGE